MEMRGGGREREVMGKVEEEKRERDGGEIEKEVHEVHGEGGKKKGIERRDTTRNPSITSNS